MRSVISRVSPIWGAKRWIIVLSAVVCSGIAGLMASATPAVAGGHSATQPATDVNVGIQPDLDYMLLPVAHALGLDKAIGLNLNISYFSQVGPEIEAMSRGSVDVVSSCSACDFAYYKSLPSLRDVIITDQFKGFIVVGRPGAPSYNALVSSGDSPKAARHKVYSYLKGRTFDIDKATFGGLLDAMLAYAHLPASAVTVKDFDSDSAAATAFLSGSGDFYMGSLTQEARLLDNFPSRVKNVGGTGILGPAGLWYSTLATTEPWWKAHQSTVLELEALEMRAAKLLASDPSKVLPIITAQLNQHSGSNFTVTDVKKELGQFITYVTNQNAKSAVYNERSPLYWNVSVRYYATQDKKSGILAKNANPAKFNADEDVFKEFEKQRKLTTWASR